MTRLLDTKDLLEYFGISRSTFIKMSAADGFPTPIRLNKKKVWRDSDIAAWVAAQ